MPNTESQSQPIVQRAPAMLIYTGDDVLMAISTSGLSKHCYAYDFGALPIPKASAQMLWYEVDQTSARFLGALQCQPLAAGLLGYSESTKSNPSTLSSLGVRSFPQNLRPETAIYEFAEKVSNLGFVRAVSWNSEDESVHVWTFIDRRDKDLRRQIYTIEFELMTKFDDLKFDFNVVSLSTLGEGPFAPSDSRGQLVFYRRA